MYPFTARPRVSRPGVVLVIVLVVVALLALSAYTFTELMLAERAGAELHADAAQSQALAESGAASVRAFLIQPKETRTQMGGVYHNPAQFQDRVVIDAATEELSGMYAVMSAELDAEGYPVGARAGLSDESSKINLNAILDSRENEAPEEETTLEEDADEEDPDDGPPQQGPPQQGPPQQGPPQQGPGDDEDDSEDADQDDAADEDVDDVLATGNTPRDALLALPGMTLEIADSILDWIDDDDIPREYGAELDYYTALTPSYLPRNGPLRTIDELLLVRGVTPSLLYGRDLNRNLQIDLEELDQPVAAEVDSTMGSIELGWSAYITVDSRESNMNPLGGVRLDLNGEDLEQLHADLSAVVDQAIADFVILYRQTGPFDDDPEEEGVAFAGTLDFERPARIKLKSILDIVGVRVRTSIDDEQVVVASPLPDQPITLSNELATLLDYTMTTDEASIVGRVNINQAPRPVLMSVPGMTVDTVNLILSQRVPEPDVENPIRSHAVWLLTEGYLTLDEMKEMLPYMNGGGDVYRAQIVGYFGDGTKASRIEVVIDGTVPDAPLLIWKDMSHLGAGIVWDEVGGGVVQ